VQVLHRVTLTSISAEVVAQTAPTLLSIHSLVPVPYCFLSICEQGTICVAVQQNRLQSNAGDNPAKDWGSFFQFQGYWKLSQFCDMIYQAVTQTAVLRPNEGWRRGEK